ncbi:Gfo/Idh/MocA family oxidoreductase [Paenibacillus sp.]|uniref:Gfo/Idh/MocA family protein n=1 Tax=Paenibacillus sp. TaxID=58172 RepID=UPI002D6BAC61|nr:Gfo/Idh/MocA family oxidoreductase [Paenibacillus sp.]HZG58780.1 Gfo/Idh/MocA family oxidoreductase [Paenibacillus sp.]
MDRKLRVLVIGKTKEWVPQWLAREDVELVGLVDAHRESDCYEGVPEFEDLETALGTTSFDLVAMATPPWAKTPMALVERLARLGHDVYLQKLRPPEPDAGETLLALAEETGRTIAIGEAYRYDPAIRAARRWIGEGALGDVFEIEWNCRRENLDAAWASAYRHVMLEDLTYHHAGAIHALLGVRWERVYAWSWTPSWSIEPNTNAAILAVADNGVRLQYTATWAASAELTPWLGDFRLEGAKGSLRYEGGRLTLRGRDGEERFSGPAAETADGGPVGVAGIVDDYIRSVRASRRTAHDIRDMIPALRLVEAALRSASERQETRGKG